MRYRARSFSRLHCTIVLSNPPKGYCELTVDSGIAYCIIGWVIQLPRLSQHIGNQTMLAKGLQCNHNDETEIDFSLDFRCRGRPMRQCLQPAMINPYSVLVGAAPN